MEATGNELDFIQLRSIAERFSEAFQQYAWDFNHVCFLLGHGKMEMIPQVPPHQGHRVRKPGFAVHRYMDVLLSFISNIYEKLLKGTSRNACIYVDGIQARQ